MTLEVAGLCGVVYLAHSTLTTAAILATGPWRSGDLILAMLLPAITAVGAVGAAMARPVAVPGAQIDPHWLLQGSVLWVEAPAALSWGIALEWIGTVGLIAALVAAGIAAGRHRRAIRRLGPRARTRDARWREAIAQVPGAAAIALSESARAPGAVVVGPGEICVAPWVADLLDADQRIALLHHEIAHIRRRHPIAMAAARTLAAALVVQPLNVLLLRRIREAMEREADANAVEQGARARSLAGALLALAEGGRDDLLLSATSARLPDRLGALRRGPPAPRSRAWLALLAAPALLGSPAPAIGGDIGRPPGAEEVDADLAFRDAEGHLTSLRARGLLLDASGALLGVRDRLIIEIEAPPAHRWDLRPHRSGSIAVRLLVDGQPHPVDPDALDRAGRALGNAFP